LCERTFASGPTLRQHILGVNNDNVQKPSCAEFFEKAKELSKTRQVCKDEDVAINYWPLTDEQNSK